MAGDLGLAGLGGEGIGMGLSIAGGIGQAQSAQAISQSSQNISQLQQQQNTIKWQQATTDFRRNSLQLLRNSQQARSLSLAAATNQGGQFGSGYEGAKGQQSGEEVTGLLGLSQNFQYGKRAYDVNNSISAQEQNIAKYQGQAAMWSGLSGAGGGITSLGHDIVSGSTNPSGSGPLPQ